MSFKLLLLGAGGQVGQAFQDLARSNSFPIGWELIAWDRESADLTSPDALIQKIATLKPEVIINAAAYTQVDKAESEKELCMQINAETPSVLARYAVTNKTTLLHYSTDYVYSGEGSSAHVESEPYHPMNAYGVSKAKGDEAVEASGCEYLTFRTSWVYSHTGKNFVKTMRRLAKERDELSVVADQWGSPTYAVDIAAISLEALAKALEKKADGMPFPCGVYHLCNSGITTWADFAKRILPGKKINGIKTSDYPTPAQRPLNSRLSLTKLDSVFGIKPRAWDTALVECLKKLDQEEMGNGY